MTLDEAIAELNRAKAELGGNAPLLMADGLNVVSFNRGDDGCLYVCDVPQLEEDEEEDGQSTFDEIGERHLAGVYKLDTDRRMPRKYARIEHAEEALAYAESTGAASPGWLVAQRRVIEALRPYWGPGVTKEQALKAYCAAFDQGITQEQLEVAARFAAQPAGK
jgi:hypothetical protein